MDVIVCLDEKNGMLFHGRRQSRDRFVTADILDHLEGKRLLIRPYSAALFAGLVGRIEIREDPLAEAGTADVCFVEDAALAMYEREIGCLYVYRWNRRYPADRYLDLELGGKWKKRWEREFPGYSHETITKEIYTR